LNSFRRSLIIADMVIKTVMDNVTASTASIFHKDLFLPKTVTNKQNSPFHSPWICDRTAADRTPG
jgi:hypothetical protein